MTVLTSWNVWQLHTWNEKLKFSPQRRGKEAKSLLEIIRVADPCAKQIQRNVAMEYNNGTWKRVPVNVCTATEIHPKREMASGETTHSWALNARIDT